MALIVSKIRRQELEKLIKGTKKDKTIEKEETEKTEYTANQRSIK